VTLTPYELWRHAHNLHHATTGNLDRRGFGDIDTLTVEEYRARSFWGRLRYRLYRHPLVMFGIGPAYLFLLQHRLPVGFMRAGWRAVGSAPWRPTWRSAWPPRPDLAGRRQGVRAGPFADHAARRVDRRLAVLCPAPVRADELGSQRQPGNRRRRPCTAARTTTCRSFLRWFTAKSACTMSIISTAAFPYYRLQRVLRDHPELRDVGGWTLWQSLRCVPLVLWDERRRGWYRSRRQNARALHAQSD
jgi:omega-6 fatty acid desaturase (delta-12 desaturase)